jgi:hypothetical protein
MMSGFSFLFISRPVFLSTVDPLCRAGPQGQSVLLVSVPVFDRTHTLVLVNLRTLEAHPMHFSADVQ